MSWSGGWRTTVLLPMSMSPCTCEVTLFFTKPMSCWATRRKTTVTLFSVEFWNWWESCTEFTRSQKYRGPLKSCYVLNPRDRDYPHTIYHNTCMQRQLKRLRDIAISWDSTYLWFESCSPCDIEHQIQCMHQICRCLVSMRRTDASTNPYSYPWRAQTSRHQWHTIKNSFRNVALSDPIARNWPPIRFCRSKQTMPVT